MRALIRKDLYVADKQLRLLLVLAVIFSVLPGTTGFGGTYAMMLAMMLPLTTMNYDERSKWDKYAAMLPYRIRDIVLSKYLLSYCAMVVGVGLILLGAAAESFHTKTPVNWQEAGYTAALLMAFMFVLVAFSIPAMYRFGAERGRSIMLVLIGVVLGGAFALARLMDLSLFAAAAGAVPTAALVAAAALVIVAGTALSIRLSMRFYENRRSGRYD